jgi:hypothetical protein
MYVAAEVMRQRKDNTEEREMAAGGKGNEDKVFTNENQQ